MEPGTAWARSAAVGARHPCGDRHRATL